SRRRGGGGTPGRRAGQGPVPAPTTAPSRTPPPSSSGTTYGDPSGVLLREVERDATHVSLELLTPGFSATPTEDGHVRVSIPGFASASQAGEPDLPSHRALVEVLAGKKVRVSVTGTDVVRYAGLRPVAKGKTGVEVTVDGSVVTSQAPVADGPAFRGTYPAVSGILQGTMFQGETKKATLLLSPLRWDGSGLVLSRRLLVRLDFVGTETSETSRGGSQGRKAVSRTSHARTGVMVQLAVKERGLYAVAFEDVFSVRAKAIPVS